MVHGRVGLLVVFSLQLFHLRRDPWAQSGQTGKQVNLAVCAAHIALAVGTTVGVILSYRRAENMLSCGVLFCIQPGDQNYGYSQGPGWRNASGIVLFFVALSMLALQLRLVYTVASELFRPRMTEHRPQTRPKGPIISSKSWTRAALVGWFLVALPVFMSAAMLMPPSFERLSADRVRHSAAVKAPPAGSVGSPERAGAPGIFVTQNWVVREGVAVMKAWPDVLLFYGFIYFVTVVGLLGQSHVSFRKFLHWRPAAFRGVSVGTVGLGTAFAVMLGLWVWYWRYVHSFLGTPSPGQPKTWPQERTSRTFGQIGSLVLGLLVLPVSRNSIWVTVFGVSWEATLWVHIWLSYFFIA